MGSSGGSYYSPTATFGSLGQAGGYDWDADGGILLNGNSPPSGPTNLGWTRWYWYNGVSRALSKFSICVWLKWLDGNQATVLEGPGWSISLTSQGMIGAFRCLVTAAGCLFFSRC